MAMIVHVFSQITKELVTQIQQASDVHDAIIFNASAYTHTSIALRDALSMYKGISIEVHISNVYQRESFRHKSMIAGAVTGVVAGFGASSYTAALTAVDNYYPQTWHQIAKSL